MAVLKKLAIFSIASLFPVLVFAGGADKPLSHQKYKIDTKPTYAARVSVAVGPRVVDDQVINASRLDTVLSLSLSGLRNCSSYNCLFGLRVAGNSGWSARYDSVGDPANIITQTLLVHNSSSLDLMAVFGWNWRSLGAEIDFGPQIAWTKWLNSTLPASSQLRLSPKLRFALTHMMKHHMQLFLAVTHAFNPYNKLSCSSGSLDCFNDEGYVDVTTVEVGASIYMQ